MANSLRKICWYSLRGLALWRWKWMKEMKAYSSFRISSCCCFQRTLIKLKWRSLSSSYKAWCAQKTRAKMHSNLKRTSRKSNSISCGSYKTVSPRTLIAGTRQIIANHLSRKSKRGFSFWNWKLSWFILYACNITGLQSRCCKMRMIAQLILVLEERKPNPNLRSLCAKWASRCRMMKYTVGNLRRVRQNARL